MNAPVAAGTTDGVYLQTCSFEVNANGWPKGNVKTVSIKQVNCYLAGGCQRSIQYGVLSQMLTTPGVNEFFMAIDPVEDAKRGLSCDMVADPVDPGTCAVKHVEEDFIRGDELPFRRTYVSGASALSSVQQTWTQSFTARIESRYQPFRYKPYVSGLTGNSSRYTDPAAACVSGFAEIRALVPTWQGASAAYSGGICSLSISGTTLGILPIRTNFELDPTPASFVIAYDAYRSGGEMVTFTMQAGVPVSPPGSSMKLLVTSSGLSLVDADRTELYSLTGRLLSITDRGGYAQTLGYDTDGRLTNVTDSFGHQLTLGYDILNRLVSVSRQ